MNVQDNIISINHSVTRIVNAVIQSNREIGQIDSLFELGLDSIQCMRIIIELEKEFNIEIEDDDLLIKKYETISSISELVNKLVSKI
ncbi:phosphopantetheine binding protein [Paenibacillus cellulosilyticus]|uniref:Phosphopantetheine binding protein n=1 Tax=Paenibacillus cellulosilyticus TaxID=375489 RepID=A0A2V2Z0T9_9BACL|nr:acyl carrier protein [Paenibacillus cellulosilyticus]PWW00790.1 phosphopantetheine binding protein [Paenibacillus cellulosilyticus]QKS45643.1 acyl carrier protein [Paenibacillus cellulosilyticus]